MVDQHTFEPEAEPEKVIALKPGQVILLLVVIIIIVMVILARRNGNQVETADAA